MPFEKIPAQPLPESPFRHAPLLRFALLAAMGILLGWYTKEWLSVYGSLCTAIVLAVAATVIYLLAGTKEKGRKTVWWVGMASVMLLLLLCCKALMTALLCNGQNCRRHGVAK